MSNDVFYGPDCEFRIGIMADKDTLPTAWFNLEFNSLTISPDRAKVDRPRLGAARHNKLDKLKPRMGLERNTADLVVDADTLMVARYLRVFLGAPTTGAAVGGIYPHVWSSGAKTEIYAAIAVRFGADKVHVLKAVSLGVFGNQWGGENTQDFDVQMGLTFIERVAPADAWPAGTVTTVTTPAPILRASLLIDAVAADQVPSGGYTWDRNLQTDFYAVTGAGHRNASYIRPGPEPVHSGQVKIRAHASTMEGLAIAATDVAMETRLLGVTTGHMIQLAHAHAELSLPGLAIGTGVLERDFVWSAHQDASTAATTITVKNNVASYA